MMREEVKSNVHKGIIPSKLSTSLTFLFGITTFVADEDVSLAETIGLEAAPAEGAMTN